MWRSIMNILLDTDVVIDGCLALAGPADGRAAAVDLDSAEAITMAAAQGHRLWIYVGAVVELLGRLRDALSPDGEAASEPATCAAVASQARALLKAFGQDKQWLAALAGESAVLEADDPAREQHVVALGRFASADILLLTRDAALLERQDARILSPAQLLARRADVQVPASPFIDLHAQQDRLRPVLERNIDRVLHHGQYVLGPEVGEVEARLADYVGVAHCVTAASGSDTLLIALMALGIGPGDEVITTPFTFIATGEMIAFLGAKPVFVDIEPRTYNLDPNRIEAAVGPRTKAILPVSLYGQCAEMDAINAIAARHGLAVIEDAAQSFGATYKGRRSGGLATIGSTSFFPAKPLGGYGEGGALFTDDEGLAKAMREIRVHGQDRRYHHPRIGINGRFDTLQAAILLAKLEQFDWEVERRGAIGARYTALLNTRAPGAVTPFIEAHNTSVYAQYTVQIDGRDQVAEALHRRGVPTAVHYPIPLHQQPAFTGCGPRDGDLPVAEAAARRVMSLPMHPDLTEAEQERIVDALCALV
jgi:UDP-2-acetamido-2-deoxy-ribo-hexuluronate aminotransferase